MLRYVFNASTQKAETERFVEARRVDRMVRQVCLQTLAIFLIGSISAGSEMSTQVKSAHLITAPIAPYKVKPAQSVSPWSRFGVFSRLPGTAAPENETVTLMPPAEVPVAPPTRRTGSDAGVSPYQKLKPSAEVFFAPD